MMQRKWGGGRLQQLPPHKDRRKWGPVTVTLLFLAVICLGFIAGRIAALRWGLPLSSLVSKRSTFHGEGDSESWTSRSEIVSEQIDSSLSTQSSSSPGGDSQSLTGKPARRSSQETSMQGGEVFLHSMDDQSLFQKLLESDVETQAKAAEAPSRPKKLAFMFLTLGDLPLAPFWAKFLEGQQGKFSLYLHSAGSASKYSNDQLPGVFAGRRVPGRGFDWGKISAVEAERRLLANALLEPDNTRFILLSDSCIPVFNFSTIYDYLLGTPLSFVKGLHVLTGDLGVGHWNSDFLPLITIREWVYGGTWFLLDRELANVVVQDFNFFSLFSRACESSKGCFPEMHYTQTMLHMFFDRKLVNRSLTWEEWSAGGIIPRWFYEADVFPANITESLVLRLGVEAKSTCPWKPGSESHCSLFARQFSPSSLDALLKLVPFLKFST